MRYIKIVEWSDEDECFVGSSPSLFYGGCHGDNETEVFIELCQIVEETIELYKTDGKVLPKPVSSRDYTNFFTKNRKDNHGCPSIVNGVNKPTTK